MTDTPTSRPSRIDALVAFANERLTQAVDLDDFVLLYTSLDRIAAGGTYAGEQPTPAQQHVAAGLRVRLADVNWALPALFTAELAATELDSLRAELAAAATRRDPAALHSTVIDTRLRCGARVLAHDPNLAEVSSPDGRFTARFQQPGRFAELCDTGNRVRVFDRGDYYSNVTAFGCTFATDIDGRTVLVVSSDWDSLTVIDPVTGRRVAGPVGDGDPFIGRLVTDPTGRWIAYDAWMWHPVSFLRIVAVDDLIAGELGESCAAAVEYLFDRPMCWVQVGATSVLASLGAEIPDDRDAVTSAPQGSRFDVVLQVELHTVNGERVGLLDVAGAPLVTGDDLAGYQLTSPGPGLVAVTADGADVARFDLTGTVPV